MAGDALIDPIALLQVTESSHQGVQALRLLDEALENAVAEEPLRRTGRQRSGNMPVLERNQRRVILFGRALQYVGKLRHRRLVREEVAVNFERDERHG
jgi:hypothetical protein